MKTLIPDDVLEPALRKLIVDPDEGWQHEDMRTSKGRRKLAAEMGRWAKQLYRSARLIDEHGYAPSNIIPFESWRDLEYA